MKVFASALILFLIQSLVAAQDNLPILKSNSNVLTIKVNDEVKSSTWRLNGRLNPDTYTTDVEKGKTVRVTFVSDIDSIEFNVVQGKNFDFFVEHKGKNYFTRIVGTPPAAVFDKKYRKKRKGKVFVEIPEVYELVNIGLALLDGNRYTRKNTEYHKLVLKHFDQYRDHPFVRTLDKDLKNDRSRYYTLKTNSYSFVYDKRGKIVQSKIYDRITSHADNSIRPYLKLMQSFSDETDFRKFYKKHKKLYRDQVRFFHKHLNVKDMLEWLGEQFPEANTYDTYKIIFSPLVGGNQSVVWFESNGFKELQPHVEYPYKNLKGASPETNIFYKGTILFTELNHGFLNPTTAKYRKEVAKAISNRYFWVAREKGPRYYSGAHNLFDEYMNWVLVNLRAIDNISDRAEQEKIINYVDRITSVLL